MPQNALSSPTILSINSECIDALTATKIENVWRDILKINPHAYSGKTIRMSEYRDLGGLLQIKVFTSDYRSGMVLGWLGVAMVPITSDGFLILQSPVESIAATVGNGIRVPGCTLSDTDFVSQIIKEMNDEFNVKAVSEQLTVLGFVESIPPYAKFHHTLIVRVRIKETLEELRFRWQTAKDKWEGEILPFELTKDNVVKAVFSEKDKYGPVTPIAIYLVAKEVLGNFLV